jgi:DNA-binding NarL/FixJ family response regulator
MTSILVIEDHPLFIQSLVRLLRERGKYDVTPVGSGEQALEQLRRSSFDLALVDISLPGTNGIDLLDEIHAAKPGMPCMMVSGHVASHYVNQSMLAGARGYVLKEDVNGILEGVRQVIRGETFISRELRPR